MNLTWIVWSPMPPECREKVSCSSPLDAARAWADRQFRRGFLPPNGIEVLVRCENDPASIRPRAAGDTRPASAQPNALTATTYQMKLTLQNAPAYRASLVGVVFEGTNDPDKEARRG